MHKDQDRIAGIKKNDDRALESLYQSEFNSIKKMVFAFHNVSLDPEDVFQEGLTRLIINVQSGRFRGDSALSTYLNSICRNICLKKLSRKDNVSLEDGIPEPVQDENHFFEILEFVGRLKNEMDEKCRTVIDLRFRQFEQEINTQAINKLMGFEEIAHQLNISADNARQRFKRCLDQLRKRVLSHPDYQTINE